MKKKLSILVCMLVFVLGLSACSGQKETAEYNQEALAQVSEFLISNFSQMTEEQFEAFRSTSEYTLNYTLMNTGIPLESDSFLAAMDAWQAGIKECGTYADHGDYSMEVKSDGAILKANASFENRDAVMEFAFDEESKLESLTVSAEYTTGEILTKAGLNTVLGMGTVFVVLIFMAWLISLMKYIPVIAEKFSGKKKEEPSEAAPVVVEETEIADETDDLELVAVITAAIAAAEGTSSDGFVVRSIKKRRKPGKWNA